MKHASLAMIALASVSLFAVRAARAEDTPHRAAQPAAAATKVYGEWLIRPQPHQRTEYRQLIETQGLPLFGEAGGRMVGWWNTLVGNLYEHLTIWEYDDMAAYERAIGFLGNNERFAKFVAARDPLLAGEDSRFLRLTPFAERPPLPDTSPWVIHEIHRVPLARQHEYLKFMEKDGLPLLKKHGFRPVGPWLVAVGKWTEVTYLFRFHSLAERDRLIAEFSAHPDGRTYDKVLGIVEEITTRLLMATPFAPATRTAATPPQSSLLPHLESIAPGVFAAGFADRHRSANCGWVTTGDGTLLVDLPRGVAVPDFLKEVARLAGKPARKLVLTSFTPDDAAIVESLVEHGVVNVLASPETRAGLLAASQKLPADRVRAVTGRTAIGDASLPINLIPLDGVVGNGGAAVHLPAQAVLFSGPFVVNGPRTRLPGSNTGRWVDTLRELERLGATQVVPGLGSWGGPTLLARQRLFLKEIRRQVGYVIAQGRPPQALNTEVRISDELLVWMPYDRPTGEDIEHVYRELTVPAAPFHGHLPDKSDRRPHALVLIADLYHEPGHVEDGLRPVFEATGVVPYFTVDVRALSAENLAHLQLLVMLRDGLQHPETGPKSEYMWMTPEQQRAVAEFVEGGGAFLNLHNSMGLYPAEGPYLKLVGGRYIGHGPLERFRVEVVDPNHPITRGVQPFFAADEQHTPPYDAAKVHLLLRNRSDDGKTVAAAGWCYEPGRGRLCHLASGHTREALLHPTYQLLLRNAVHWCLRSEPTGQGRK